MALSKIWIYAEATGAKPTTATLEMLTKARELGSTVEAFYTGSAEAAADLAGPLGEYGVTTLHHLELADTLAGAPAAASLQAAMAEAQPDLVLFGQTYEGRDVLARLQARTGANAVTNGVGLSLDGDDVVVGTAIFGGNTLVDTKLTGAGPKLAAIRPKSFAAEPSGGGPATVVAAPAVDVGRAGDARVLERHEEASEGPKLEDATIVVSGGRGLGGAENYALVEEIAKLLRGASGASRAIVDAGWVPYSKQVGQTGKVVKPKLYIACGISGATQHMVGMKGSENIIAVNKDGEAPIFSVADLGIVGDVHKVLPKLIEALKAR
jgi:electron transfer flavoprotein alpha subunit